MRITLSQQVLLKGRPNTFRTAYKHFESNVIPHEGDKVADSAFKDPYEFEVVNVIINYQDNTCHVSLRMIEIDSDNEKDIEGYLEIYRLHDWDYPEF